MQIFLHASVILKGQHILPRSSWPYGLAWVNKVTRCLVCTQPLHTQRSRQAAAHIDLSLLTHIKAGHSLWTTSVINLDTLQSRLVGRNCLTCVSRMCVSKKHKHVTSVWLLRRCVHTMYNDSYYYCLMTQNSKHSCMARKVTFLHNQKQLIDQS